MARYVTLIQFTETGARNLSRSTKRAQAFARAAGKAGVKVEAQFWTAGPYDGVLVLNAPDERKALHCLAELAEQGYVRTQTLPAYTADEFDKIVRG